MIPYDFGNDEPVKFLRNVRIQPGLGGQPAQARDLARLALRIGRRQRLFGLEAAYFMRHLEALRKQADDRRIEIVDARALLAQSLGGCGGVALRGIAVTAATRRKAEQQRQDCNMRAKPVQSGHQSSRGPYAGAVRAKREAPATRGGVPDGARRTSWKNLSGFFPSVRAMEKSFPFAGPPFQHRHGPERVDCG